MRTWRCDHPHTPRNTSSDGYCLACRREKRATPEGYAQRRRYLVPQMLDLARRRVAQLENELRRLGLEP